MYQRSEEKGFEDGNYGTIAVMLSVLEGNVAIVCGMFLLYCVTTTSADSLFFMTACLPALRYYSWYTWWSARYRKFIEWLWKDKEGHASGIELRNQTIGLSKPKDAQSGAIPRPPYSPQLNDVHLSPGELMAEPIDSSTLPLIPRLPSVERHESEDVAHMNEMAYRNV